LSPAEAVAEAAKILKNAMSVFAPSEAVEPAAAAPGKALIAEGGEGRWKDLMDQSVDIIDLTVRASNCLKAAKIRTIGDLVSKTETELLDFKNFGRKSLDEIRDRLKEMKLELGMAAPAGDSK
jgi:DNA-directed RNA polymerase subunit alpha